MSAPAPAPVPTTPVVSQLFVYPVKSCAGIRVAQARIDRSGFEDDRRWMITDPEGRFVTQRELPLLSQLRVEFGSRPDDPTYRMTGLGQEPIEFPRRLSAPRADAEVRVSVWGDEVLAFAWQRLGAWLSAALGRPLRAVFVPDAALRRVNPRRAEPEDRVGFADGYPFLLVSEESLSELNGRLARRGEAPLDVRRFRPNIVVSGCARAHEEDDWRTLTLGSVDFRMLKLCDRCSVTTVDPDSGTRGTEPLRTLSDYRRWDGKVWFAVNLVHNPAHEGRSIAVGDSVQVLTRAGAVSGDGS